MKFEQRYPDAKTTERFEFEYSHVTKDAKLGQCFVCGAYTRWIDLKFQKHVCSEECCGAAWKEQSQPDLEDVRKVAEAELVIAAISKPAWKDILVIVRDQLPYLKICVESVREHTKNYTLHIWDNESGPETQEYIANLQQEHASLQNPDWKLKVRRSERNEGFIEPNNALAEDSEGDYLIPLNSDTKVFPHWDTAMIGWLQQYPEVAQVGYWGGHLGPDGRGFGGQNGYDVDYIPGWCFCISRETYNQFGLFNKEMKFAYCEDADLSLTLQDAGKKIYALHVPLVYHYQNKTIKVVEKEGEVDVRATFEHNHEYLRRRWKDYLENRRVLQRRGKDSNEAIRIT